MSGGMLTFTKMHGCGNDYIYFNCFEDPVEAPEQLAVRLSDRHKGVGGDGVILICPSEIADAKMRMFNNGTVRAAFPCPFLMFPNPEMKGSGLCIRSSERKS